MVKVEAAKLVVGVVKLEAVDWEEDVMAALETKVAAVVKVD